MRIFLSSIADHIVQHNLKSFVAKLFQCCTSIALFVIYPDLLVFAKPFFSVMPKHFGLRSVLELPVSLFFLVSVCIFTASSELSSRIAVKCL